MKESQCEPERRHYAGIRVHAIPGCHEWVAEWILQNTSGEGFVLDLGAGEGALSQRLADLGLNILATDRSPEQWKVKSIRCEQVDFDEPGWASRFLQQNVRAICMVECIEHTANPRDVLNNVMPIGARASCSGGRHDAKSPRYF